jgi:hypothetical protein
MREEEASWRLVPAGGRGAGPGAPLERVLSGRGSGGLRPQAGASIETSDPGFIEKPQDAFYRQEAGAQGRRSRCKPCYKALEREIYVKDPKVQARRRQILDRWREEG